MSGGGDYFEYNVRLLRLFCVWRLEPGHRYHRWQSLGFYVIVTSCSLHVASILGGFGSRAPEYTFGPLSFQFMCVSRMTFMWLKQGELLRSIGLVKRESFRFEDRAWEEVRKANEEEARRFCLAYLKGFLLLMLFDVPPSFVGTLCYNLYVKYGRSNATLLDLPYETYFPFDVTKGNNYFIAWTSQMVFVDYLSFSIPDTMLLAISMHLIYQVKTLKHCLLSLAEIDISSMEDELEHKRHFVKINRELQIIYE